MRFPKTVRIAGRVYNVRTDSRCWGGNGGTGGQEIVVGTRKDQSTERKFGNFMHEVLEIAACERNLRYTASDDEVVLVMTHRQFSHYSDDISAALWPMVKC